MATYRLKFTPEAVQDITDAAHYYEDQKPGLGRRFRNLVKSKLLQIRKTPLAYEVRYDNVRFAMVDIFPYSIHFTTETSTRIIQIHAVLCQYRNPVQFWKGFEE